MFTGKSHLPQEKIFEMDKGRCDAWRKHIFNFTASIESPQFNNRTARMFGSGWRLSGVFRAQSGTPLTVVSGVDRALSGIQATTQRPNQVQLATGGDAHSGDVAGVRRDLRM